MESTRWQQIEDTFHALAELPPGPAREQALAARCGDDAALVDEVRTLLAQDALLTPADRTADPHVGLRLGSYEVRALVARGGMASVYRARRADDAFEQQVAVKIMDLRVSDPAQVARFRSERQILAALEHAAITRLLDGGVTSLGEPYLVMEFVEGQPIDRACDARRLDVTARIRLFLEVCDAVAFAHRSLVLHRDLKPSNILVTDEGRVKVVDFGTATLLQPERDATTSAAPLTPAYASPEQLTGRAVGTAADQYSLGLVLFELLAGALPFGERMSLIGAVERALSGTTTAPHAVVTEAAAARRQTTAQRLRRLLSGDLATILAKALADDPGARYASVQHLADDLRHWMAGEPVVARPASIGYRSRRFVRRHWPAVSAAATLAGLLVASTAVSIQQAAVARAESAKVRQLNGFLTGMLSSANPTWHANAVNAGSITVREVLDGAAQRVTEDLGAAPAVEAEMQRTLGRTYLGLGAAEQALPHLQRALELYRAQRDEFGTAFTNMLLGEQRLYRGDSRGAEPFLRAALGYVRARGADADPELHLIAANDLGLALMQHADKPDEAGALLREAVAVSDDTGLNAGGASVAVNNLGVLAYREGRIDEAKRLYRESLRRMNALPALPPERSALLANLADLMISEGEYAEAEQLAGQAEAQAVRQRPPDHPILPRVRAIWGRALALSGDTARARPLLENALRALRAIRPDGHPDLLTTLLALGTTARLEGQLDLSERHLRDALSIVRASSPAKMRLGEVTGELGLTLRARGIEPEAKALLEEGYGAYREVYGDGHPATRRALARLQGAE